MHLLTTATFSKPGVASKVIDMCCFVKSKCAFQDLPGTLQHLKWLFFFFVSWVRELLVLIHSSAGRKSKVPWLWLGVGVAGSRYTGFYMYSYISGDQFSELLVAYNSTVMCFSVTLSVLHYYVPSICFPYRPPGKPNFKSFYNKLHTLFNPRSPEWELVP